MRIRLVLLAVLCACAFAQGDAAFEPVSVSLARMSPAERANACISVEFERTDEPARQLGRDVEGLWNSGRCAAALAALAELESRVGPREIAVGISWREPVPTPQTDLWGNDVRVVPFDSLSEVTLSVHRPTGNLFVLARSGRMVGDKLRLYMSDDGGSTWINIWGLSTPDTLMSTDAAVLGDYLYVLWINTYRPYEAQIQRHRCVDGARQRLPNGQYSAVACALVSPDSVKEMALVSNQDGANDRLWLATLATSGDLHWSQSDTGAINWSQVVTGVTDASHGLDATENQGGDSTFCFCSFYTRSDSMVIYGVTDSGLGRRRTEATGGDYTSISSYEDTTVCSFDFGAAAPARVRCLTNYGDSEWAYTDLSDTTVTSESPALTARGGGGVAAVFRHGSSSPELHFRQREYSGGAWSVPVSMADGDVGANRQAVEYLGSGAFGVAFLSGNAPVVRGAYFDRTDWGTGVRQDSRLLVEQGVLRVSPNPLAGRGLVSFTLERAASVAASFYDGSGRVVRRLCAGTYAAGRHSIQIDAADMNAGVYFLRAEAAGQGVTIPVTVVH